MKIIVCILILVVSVVDNARTQALLVAKTIDSTHHAVVAILREDDAGNILVAGSGVLIHPSVILTAGHINFNESRKLTGGCNVVGYVSNSSEALSSKNGVSFNWLNDVESYPDTALFSKSFTDTTGRFQPVMFTDLGLIFLDKPIANVVCASLPKPQQLKSFQTGKLIGVGFGYHKLMHTDFEFSMVDGLRRRWSVDSFSFINDRWLSVPCDTVTRQQFMNICDSGSPLLYNDTTVVGTWCIAGVYPYPGMAVRIDNPKVLHWIREKVKKKLGVKV